MNIETTACLVVTGPLGVESTLVKICHLYFITNITNTSPRKNTPQEYTANAQM